MVPGSTDQEPDSGYSRLEQQIQWYDTKSSESQKWFKGTRLAQLGLTACIPVLAFAEIAPATAAVAALALVLSAVQELNQWQHNWITYRSTAEALRHEKYAFLGKVAPYDCPTETERHSTLVQRVESLISTEHSKWVGRMQTRTADVKSQAQAS